MRISALDQSPVFDGQTPAQALRATQTLAIHCDKLNLHRFWVAEHHGSKSFAGCAPEILISSLGNVTEHIHLGSGGVMLSHYSPYKVAESFKTLSALYPNRIDLGIGRAPGGDPWQSGALAWGSPTTTVNYYPSKVADLNAWLKEVPPITDAFRRVKVTPQLGLPPNVFALVSSVGSMNIALDNGLPIVLAYFIDPNCLHLGKEYKRQWIERKLEGEPQVILAVFSLCADNVQLANDQASSVMYWRSNLQHGGKFKTAQNAKEMLSSSTGQANPQPDDARVNLVGTQDQIAAKLQPMLEASQADELMVITICESQEVKHQSYEYLQEIVEPL